MPDLTPCIVLAATLSFLAGPPLGGEEQPLPDAAGGEVRREYSLLFGGIDDPATYARAGLDLDKAMSDLYYYGIGRAIPPTIDAFAATAWQVWWSFMTTIWPHEFGHWSRARQIGGEFVFERLSIPWPETRMDLPATRSLAEEALTSVGGFEINYLMRAMALDDLYSRGYSFSDELIHSFIQGIYYPGYAWVVAPLVNGGWIDPADPDTWIHTMGDPVESTLLVFKSFTGRQPITGEGRVDPDLVAYYWESLIMSLAWTLLDPALYEGARAFNVDMRDNSGLVRSRMWGDPAFSWSYGTMFNASPLGYELYLVGRFQASGCYASAYLKYGRPFLNLGAGLAVPRLIEVGPVAAGGRLDYWYEGPYGQGIALDTQVETSLGPAVGLVLGGGWKSAGYLVGRPLGQSWSLRGGLRLSFEPHINVKSKK